MIEANAAAFPNNIVFALRNRLVAYNESINAEIPVFLRPIRVGDPIQAWGLTASMWDPDEDSWEFGSPKALYTPTLNRYVVGVQTFNQDMDSERGLQVAATMAGVARNLLSRDTDIRVAFASLTSTEFGFTERVTRHRILGQRFLSNEIEGKFYHLTNLEFHVETEITP